MTRNKTNNCVYLLYKGAPASYNTHGSKRLAYKNAIQNAYERYYEGKLDDTELYGLVYHFFRKDIDLDADNLSKPVWDSLTGKAFSDDKQIIIRSSMSIDLTKHEFSDFDTTCLSDWDNVGDFLFELSKSETNHLLLIIIGKIEVLSNIFNATELWKY